MTRLLIALLTLSTVPAQVAEKANAGYKTKEGRDRVASVLTAPDRDSRQKPVELVQNMGLKPGIVVADIGTGVGYMLPFLSKAVGPDGKVVAEDIENEFLEKAAAKAEREKLGNVAFVKGTAADANLPAAAIDVALTLDSYHHYDYPDKMLASIAKGLKPRGKLVIVDFYRRPNAMPNGNAMEHIRIDDAEVIKEVEAAGFKLVSRREHIPGSQYMLTFEWR